MVCLRPSHTVSSTTSFIQCKKQPRLRATENWLNTVKKQLEKGDFSSPGRLTAAAAFWSVQVPHYANDLPKFSICIGHWIPQKSPSFALFLGIISGYKNKGCDFQTKHAFSYPVILLLWARQTFSAVSVWKSKQKHTRAHTRHLIFPHYFHAFYSFIFFPTLHVLMKSHWRLPLGDFCSGPKPSVS